MPETEDTEPSRTEAGNNDRTYVHIYAEWCKGCAICVAFCPKKVLEMGDDLKAHVVHPERCIRCALCARRCPDFAVTVLDEELVSVGEEDDH
ncbi:4Fe-4S binding protein [Candidatus Fermentibacterales bacterium]|nr:4Fe-4S binding protein [Candidatus Fermentibacterales bacterium]